MKLTLIGAGPGDPELITIKGQKALQNADVVLYDALINTELLKYAPKAEHIYVGKRRAIHSMSQEQINDKIIELSKTNKNIVRLKSGDPFIFGRGHEEIDFAESHGMTTDVIPGVSSIQLGGLFNIPLTRRGVNDSFWVVTATCEDGSLSREINLAAQSTSTLVILMGLHKLNEIVDIMKKSGKENASVALISKGSWPDEKIVTGTVNNIEEVVAKENINAPTIIIIGDVVDLFRH